MDLFESLKSKINGKNLTIVFPEGEEPRILGAATRLVKENVLKPILVGEQTKIEQVATEKSFDISNI